MRSKIVIETPQRTVVLAATKYDIPAGFGRAETFCYLGDGTIGLGLQDNPTKAADALHARNLQLHCSSLTVTSPGAALWTAGDKGLGVGPAAQGKDAGNIWITAREWITRQPDTVDLDKPATLLSHYPLRLNATGGDGAEGVDGPTATDGGNGGKGGQVMVTANTDFANAVREIAKFLPTRDSILKDVDALNAWLLLAKDQFPRPASLAVAIKGLSLITDFYKVADQFFTTNKGDVIDTVTSPLRKHITDSVVDLADKFIHYHTVFMSRVYVDVTGGSYGTGGRGATDGSNGEAGGDGSYTISRLDDSDYLSSPVIMIHPDQVAMAVREVENRYYSGQSNEAAARVAALLESLKWLEKVDQSSPIWNTYLQQESGVFVVSPAADRGTSEPTSITSLKNSRDKLKNYSDQLALGYDFYGHAPTWVPRNDPQVYVDEYKTASTHYMTLESLHKTFQDMAADHRMTDGERKSARAAAQTAENQAEADIIKLREYMKQSLAKLYAHQAAITQDLSALQRAVQDAIKAIKHNVNFSIKEFVSTASQFIFAPSGAMAAVQALGLADTALNTVKDTTGVDCETNYVVSEINTMARGIAGIDETLQQSSQSNDFDDKISFQVDKSAAAKLLGARDDILTWQRKYLAQISATGAKELAGAIEKLFERVMARNTEILQYNTYIVLWRQALKSKQEAASAVDIKDAQLAAMDTLIPAFAVAVDKAFFTITANLLKILYWVDRALFFYTLQPHDDRFVSMRAQGFPMANASATLEEKFGEMLNELKAGGDRFSSIQQKYGTVEGKSYGEARKWSLNGDALYTLQQSPHEAMVVIPAVGKGDTNNDFGGYWDTRVTRVGFVLKGVQTTSDEVDIVLTHAGDSTIVDDGNLPITFSHAPITLECTYKISTGELTADITLESEQNAQMALPGPFATWTISLPPSVKNAGLDMSKVKEAYFEFSGKWRAFPR